MFIKKRRIKYFFIFLTLNKELKTDEDWYKHQYYKNFNLDYSKIPDKIDRIDVNKVSIDEFIERYERPYKPCILLNSQNDWMAKEKWTLEV
jgi:histone arginine demethylase JMJD6